MVEGGPVLVAQPQRAVGRPHDAFDVAAERIVVDRISEQVDRLLVGVGEALGLSLEVRAAGDGRAVGAGEAKAIGDRQLARRRVELEGVDLELEVGKRERTLQDAVAVNVDRLGVGTAIGMGEEPVASGLGVDAVEEEAGEAPEQDVLPRRCRAEKRQVRELVGLQRGVATNVVDPGQSDDLGDRGAGEIDDRDGVVLLERDPCRRGVGRDRDVLGLDVLRHRCVGAEDAHERAEIGAVEGREVGGEHRLRSHVLDAARDVDDAHRALGIDRVVVVWLRLVGGQHLRSIGGERDHVGLGADGHGLEEAAVAAANSVQYLLAHHMR